MALADGVTMQLTVRSTNEDVADLVTSAIGWLNKNEKQCFLYNINYI